MVEDAASHKSGSSRLGMGKFNLRNPLSLLARRRASQNQPQKAEDGNLNVNTVKVPSLPDDYDPRIRGKIVHDFSIPKARRLKSYNWVSSAETSPSIDSHPSTQSIYRPPEGLEASGSPAGRNPQSPVHSSRLNGHGKDDRHPLQPQATSYLHTLAHSSGLKPSNEPPRLPEFAKSLPLDIFGEYDFREQAAAPAKPQEPVQPASQVIDTPPWPEKSVPNRTQSTDVTLTGAPPPDFTQVLIAQPSPETSLRNAHQPADAISAPSVLPANQDSPPPDFLKPFENVPKHMTSTSSRFSFQLTGVDSEAEERLLEEKHKQHFASKFPKTNGRDDLSSCSEISPSDDIAFSDDDGFEERVPGVNADFDEPGGDTQRRPLDCFHFTPQSSALNPTTPNISGAQPTPRDGEGQVIGLASTRYSPHPGLVPTPPELGSKQLGQSPWLGGLGITSLESLPGPSWTGIVPQFHSQAQGPQQDADDLYFDDGIIEDLDEDVDGESFDEDLFDDETGKIHDIPAQNARKLELAIQQNFLEESNAAPGSQLSNNVGAEETTVGRNPSNSTDPSVLEDGIGGENARQYPERSALDTCSGLTEDNLAYQNALVSAANEAAAQGRFSRHLSMSVYSEDLNSKSPIAESQPGLISDESRFSHLLDNAGAEDEPDDFAFDDSLDDDPIIAEANAEVLENDDEGFYGQEFGFYARAHGKGNSEMVNGGYFGPMGVEGVHRSHSAKGNFQEPCLTPITERSEWSHRNSIASLHTLGLPPAVPALPSPGIAELLDLDPSSFEDEMSMSALMKLRRGAWGGSQTSLNSIGGSQPGSSPLAQPPLMDGSGSELAGQDSRTPNGNEYSRFSYDCTAILPEVFEEDSAQPSNSATDTHTILPHKKPSDFGLPTLVPDSASHLPGLPQATLATEKSGRGHSRASSGAESVSYTKDPEGSGRWLLERRRTGDDGELELIGREYVAGARI